VRTILLSILLLLSLSPLRAEERSAPALELSAWDQKPRDLEQDFMVLPTVQDPESFQKEWQTLGWSLAPVQTHFSKLKIGDRSVASHDSVAFALQLRGIPEGEYGLRLRADTSAEVYIIPMNGQGKIQKVLSIGRAGKDEASTIPAVADPLGHFRIPAAGDYWILVNAANYHYKEGMIWRRPMIGSYEVMHRSWLLEIVQENFAFGIIAILTIYNLALFFNRTEDPSNLWLAGYCFFALLRFFAVSALNLSILFPESSVLLHRALRIMELGFVPISCVCFANFAIANFGNQDYWRRKSQIFMGAALLFALAALSFDTRLLPNLIIPLDLFALVAAVITMTLLFKAIRQKMTGARLMLCGALVFLATVTYDILCGLNIIESPFYLTNYGLSTFIFFQGQVVAKLFARAFRTAQVLSAHLEEEVDKKTRDIQGMLDNIPLGICSIDSQGRILPNYSVQLPSIIGVKEPAGQDYVQAIFGSSNLSVDLKDTMHQSLLACFDDDVISFESNAAHLPEEVTISYDGQRHDLQCIWSPITDKNNCVARVLLVLRDITSLKQAEAQRLEHQRELEYIIELVNVSPDKFQGFVVTSMQFLAENDRLIRQNPKKDPEIVKIIFVNMHTMKGAARTLGFYKMTSLLHEVEQVYSALLRDPDLVWHQQNLLESMQEVKAVFDYYVKLNHEKLGRTVANSTEVSISREALEHQNRTLRSIQVSRLEPQDALKLRDTIQRIEDLCFSEASDVFLDILSSVHRVARDLGKEIPIINVEARGFKLKQSAHEMLANVFVHIIRNSLDHGIETAAERVAVGKRPTGRIDVRLQQQGDRLAIEYRDDGRGLNMRKLREKAHRDQLLTADELKSPQKVAELIFISGLSTAQALTEVSGRGVGMDAVRRYLENNGGQIQLRVQEEVGGFASFSIHLLLASTHFINAQETLGEAS
jgi:PAS domain-containing protein